MESINVYYFGYAAYTERIGIIAEKIKSNKNIKNIFGVPRGGLIAATHLSYMTGKPLVFIPTKNTIIIDDCIDSGNTKLKYSNHKYFEALVDKKKEKINQWIDFWWDLPSDIIKKGSHYKNKCECGKYKGIESKYCKKCYIIFKKQMKGGLYY